MTKIEWTNETWNPIIGCNKISPGCDNCYAEKMAHRLMHMPYGADYQFVLKDNGESDPEKYKNLPKWNGETHFQKSQLEKPLKWKKPRMIFVVSMGDLFHESNFFEDIIQIFQIIIKCPQHTFQILTKRAERMLNFFQEFPELSDLKNVWLGVTAENQEQTYKRIPFLLQTRAAIRFVSIEPMLSKIDLTKIVVKKRFDKCSSDISIDALKGWHGGVELDERTKLDWVICGGESGHKARPMHPDWVQSLRDQCKESNVPFFFKQWGEYLPIMDPKELKKYPLNKLVEKHEWQTVFAKLGKSKTGRLLDGKEHNEMPIINK